MGSQAGRLRVAIVGAGAMGGLFGFHLAKVGAAVWLIDTWSDHVDTIAAAGLRLTTDDSDQTLPVRATTRASEAGTADVVLVQVKTTALEEAAASVAQVTTPDTVVVTLQNGIGAREVIASAVGGDRVAAGVTYNSAMLVAPGHVRQTAVGPTYIGEPARHAESVGRLASALAEAGLPTSVSEHLDSHLWGKLMVNAVFNPLCALTGYRSGDLLSDDASHELAAEVVREVTEVVGRLGVRLPYSDPWERITQIAAGAGRGKPSMLVDMERGQRTEIDYINGAVVRAADQLNVPVPVNGTLTRLVKMAEAHRGADDD